MIRFPTDCVLASAQVVSTERMVHAVVGGIVRVMRWHEVWEKKGGDNWVKIGELWAVDTQSSLVILPMPAVVVATVADVDRTANQNYGFANQNYGFDGYCNDHDSLHFD
uniref:Uncharacterized protein n=1 Tax=Cacopsylla melanoneura TaxID=428564 RepID=A0A8D8TDK7_9HEMI